MLSLTDYNAPGQPGGYGQPAGYSSNVVVVTQPGAGMTARPGACRHCGVCEKDK